MIRRVAVTGFLATALLSGCATAPKTFVGASGPVKWEVVDIGQVVATNDNGLRWSYTVVLTNTGTSTLRFDHVLRGSRAHNLETSSVRRLGFDRTLAPGARTSVSFVDVWEFNRSSSGQFGGTASLSTITIERRFMGQDDHGSAVVVPVIMHFDRGVGKIAARRSGGVLPPPTDVRPGDLSQLAGTWTGYYRNRDDVFAVPLRIEVSPDGTFEAFENDPVTNRTRGHLRAQSGQLAWSQRQDEGTVSLHEGSGRRILRGTFQGPRDDAATPYVFQAELWLEAATGSGPPVTTTALATPSPQLRPSVQEAFEQYKADPKYTHFKAFAVDRRSDVWGRSWSLPSAASAMDRALYECRKRSAGCVVYAVGDTILDAVSPELRAAILLGGAQLTYKGTLTTVQQERTESSAVMFYLFRGRTEITGSWSREEPLLSGVITGGVSDTNRATVRMTQSTPCRVEFEGVVSIGDEGRTLDVSYAGPGCDGIPQKATFVGVRQ